MFHQCVRVVSKELKEKQSCWLEITKTQNKYELCQADTHLGEAKKSFTKMTTNIEQSKSFYFLQTPLSVCQFESQQQQSNFIVIVFELIMDFDYLTPKLQWPLALCASHKYVDRFFVCVCQNACLYQLCEHACNNWLFLL